MDEFRISIRKKYKERLLKREQQWPPVNGEKYIKMQLVEETDKTQDHHKESVFGETKVKVKRSPISQGDLFKVTEGKKPVRKLIIAGNAGMGKTTLCNMLAEEWAEDKVLTQFDCVLLLPLRERSVSTATSLHELFKLLHSSEEIRSSVIKELERREGEGVLIIADGWDELDSTNREQDSFLYNLLINNILSFCSVLVTSRPTALGPLRNLPSVNRLVEVVGFNEENVNQYIESEFENYPEKGTALIRQLESNPVIRNVCSVPLNCSIICYLWKNNEVLPFTTTKLYAIMIRNVIFRNIKKKFPELCPPSLKNFDQIPECLHSTFWVTCKFAYECLAKDQIVFTPDNLKATFPEVLELDSNFQCFGLLQSSQSLVNCGYDFSFHFLHLTFQEFLAAFYLSTLTNIEKENLCNALNKEDFKDRFAMVWRFLFGLGSTKEKCSYSKKVVCFDQDMVDKFVASIVEEDRDRHDYLTYTCSNTLLMCHCALESEDPRISDHFAWMIDGQFEDSYDNLYDFAAVLNILAHTHYCSEVVIDLRKCGLDDKQLSSLTTILSNAEDRLQVKKLYLDNSKVTDKGAIDLFCRAPKSFTSLCELSLEGNKIIDVISPLMETHCKTLADLTLADTLLGATGIQSLQSAIESNYLCALESIDLSHTFTEDTDINGALLYTLLKAIGIHCPILNSITLSRNNLGVSGGGALGETLPQLMITCDRRLRIYLNDVKFDCEAMESLSSSFPSSFLGQINNQLSKSVSYCSLDLDDNPLGSCGLLKLLLTFKSPYCKITHLQLDKICSVNTASSECNHNSHVLNSKLSESDSYCCSNNSLEHLCLSNNSDDGEMCISMLNLAIHAGILDNLEYLDLSNTFTQDASINGKLLASLLPLIVSHCHRLSHLDLSQNKFIVPGASAIRESFSGLICRTKLSKIDLSKTHLNNEALRVFFSFMPGDAVSIKNSSENTGFDLTLYENPLELDGLLAIVEVLRSNNFPIKELDLESVITVTSDFDSIVQQPSLDIRKLSSNLGSQNITLTRLCLCKNKFGANAALIISSFIQLCSSLEELTCSNCSLTTVDVRQILRALESSKATFIKLKDWNLRKNLVQDEGVNQLIKCIPDLFPNLEEVDFDNNPASDSVKTNLNNYLKTIENARLAKESADKESELKLQKESSRKEILLDWKVKKSLPHAKKQQEFFAMWKELLKEICDAYLSQLTEQSLNSVSPDSTDHTDGIYPKSTTACSISSDNSKHNKVDSKELNIQQQLHVVEVKGPLASLSAVDLSQRQTLSTCQSENTFVTLCEINSAPHKMDQQEAKMDTLSCDSLINVTTPTKTTPSQYSTISATTACKLQLKTSTVTIEELKVYTKVTDSQLDDQILEKDMYKLSAYFDNVESYLNNLDLTPSQKTDIEDLCAKRGTQIAMSKALKLWREPNPFAATYRALVMILMDLGKGDVAANVCRYLNSKRLHKHHQKKSTKSQRSQQCKQS